MKRVLMVAALASMIFVQANAQTPERAREQSCHIISTLGLSGEVADEFAELYCDYKQAMLDVKKDCPMIHRRHADCQDQDVRRGLTDEEIEQNIFTHFEMGHKMLDVREKYYKKFRKILTPSQIQAMYMAEKRHASHMEQHVHHRRNADACRPRSQK